MGRIGSLSRRRFVTTVATAGTGVALASCWGAGAETTPEDNDREERAVTPAEDLMFEHGVIERLLLIYEEAARRIDAGTQVSGTPIFDAASIIRSFAEDYHEKLEEQFIFPRLEQAGRYAGLARTLQAQHAAGRDVTRVLLDLSAGGTLTEPARAAEAMRSFVRMYIPHISRENSVAFRAFHDLTPPEEYAELGEQFEDKEHSLFGEDGFERNLDRVAAIEKELGIYDLARFTPKKM